jgi:SAM-dependent methyltransferase
MRADLAGRIEATTRLGWRQVPQVGLVGALWWYSASVLYPARIARRAGVQVVGDASGEQPQDVPRTGAGRWFCDRHPDPVLLTSPDQDAALVEEFDRLARLYELCVWPFSTPIFAEAVRVMRTYVAPNSRLLDLGCGPGRELRRMARYATGGEVVGVDLAAGMVSAAHAEARAQGIENCAFFQANAADLPREFTGKFDMVYSSLAHHHFPDSAGAAAAVLRCLRAGGVYCVIDPGPEWFNALSAPLGRLADPGWMGWNTPEGFMTLLPEAGFARSCWIPLLPGFGMAVGQKSVRALRGVNRNCPESDGPRPERRQPEES